LELFETNLSEIMEVSMQSDRRAILSLLAARRITAAEAERLLIIWNDRRESFWLVAFCITALSAQANLQYGLSALLDVTHMLLPTLTLHHAATTLTHFLGAIL
jgi:hypothetical protein